MVIEPPPSVGISYPLHVTGSSPGQASLFENFFLDEDVFTHPVFENAPQISLKSHVDILPYS
jgi:hypothetical protein